MQPTQLATSTGGYLVSNAQYGPAGEMTDFGAEHRTYNNRLQLTRIQGTGYDYRYDYNTVQFIPVARSLCRIGCGAGYMLYGVEQVPTANDAEKFVAY
jgi:hypothetical protein